MTSSETSDSESSAAGRWLPVVLLLFVGSGCAALIYEIVWLQMLQLVIGSSAVSLGVLLGTFMGGMCLGSLLLPRWISQRHHPLRVYALLELGIGVVGLALLFLLPQVDEIYAASAMRGTAGVFVRGMVAALCLLPPTMLMGATLPAAARFVEATPRGISWLGFFYGGNIAGAVLGCLLAGFYLLRLFDMATATYVAAAINAVVAAIGWILANASQLGAAKANETPVMAERRPVAWTIYLAIGLSGLGALGAEVVWTRILSLIIGGTVYTFSIILAVFLIGLGIGSTWGAVFARESRSPRLVLGACQFLLAGAIGWAAYMLAVSLPMWPVDPSLARNPWLNFQLDLARCLWAVLPAATLWGTSFPLALAAAADRVGRRDAGRLVGGIYAANTVGAILGAVIFSVVIVGWMGTQRCEQVLVVVAGISGLVTLAPVLFGCNSGQAGRLSYDSGQAGGLSYGPIAGVLLTVGMVAAGFVAYAVPETPGELIAHGRRMPTRRGQYQMLYHGEGVNSSVAVTVYDERVRNFHVSGKIEASSEPQDMRLQRMLGHIPALVHPQPKSVLVVGCGAGVTAGSFVVHPSVERIVICEIEPLIPKIVAEYFAEENYGVVKDKKVEIVFDDARHYILTTREKFDVITSDPINPWVKGAASLYTSEYFELCKRRLNEGGVITQWVPLYESSVAAVKSELATFFAVFPEGTVWSNDLEGRGYDVVLLGQVGPLKIDIDQLQERLGRGDHFPVDESLYQVGFNSGLDLLATFAGTAKDLTRWLKEAEINRDRNLRLQYLAGFAAHDYREITIFNEMLEHRKYPQQVFIASEDKENALRVRLGLPK